MVDMPGDVEVAGMEGDEDPKAGDAVRPGAEAVGPATLPRLGEAVDGIKGAAEGFVPPLLLPPTAGLPDGTIPLTPGRGRFDWALAGEAVLPVPVPTLVLAVAT